MVSTTQGECHFVPASIASEIMKKECGTNSKSQNTIDGIQQVKARCWKLQSDRLGNITNVIKAK
jgi:CRISPR-associated endonuclease Csn1